VDHSNNDGGPDEFDEKNRAFTNYIDNLIKSKPGEGSGDDLSEASGRSSRRTHSLIEVVYGAREFEIVDYKRAR
jgi:hypothetical protein